MSLLKHILSPFVEFEDDKKEPQKTATVNQRVDESAPVNYTTTSNASHPFITGANTGSTTPAAATVPKSSAVQALPEHEQYFEKLIDEANVTKPLFAGTDYKEFIDSKTDIDNITDEETKYKTAFNVLKRTGLTKEKLISTAHEYHNIIGRDLNAFQSAYSQQYQKEVKQREQLIQQKAEEMQALSEKMNVLKKEISQISQQLVETKEKLNATKNSFLLAGENKQKEIQTELQKIGQYF